MTRRAAVLVVALVAAALVGVGLLAIPGSPLERRPTLGLDLQGGLEVTLQAVPPRDRELTKADLDRSVEIMREPRRPPRRGGARDPHAGRRPDLDPAARRRRPGRGREHHRQDGPARAVRPREGPRLAVDRRADAAADRDGEALRPPRGPAGARGARRSGVLLRLPGEGEEARPRPRRDARGGARQVGRQAAEGPQALRRAAEHGGRPVRPRRGGLPGRRRAQPDDELVLPLPLHAARGSRDDGEGPEPRRARGRTSTRRPASRSS